MRLARSGKIVVVGRNTQILIVAIARSSQQLCRFTVCRGDASSNVIFPPVVRLPVKLGLASGAAPDTSAFANRTVSKLATASEIKSASVRALLIYLSLWFRRPNII